MKFIHIEKGFFSVGSLVVLNDVCDVHSFIDLEQYLEDTLWYLHIIFIDPCFLYLIEALLFAGVELLHNLSLYLLQKFLELNS